MLVCIKPMSCFRITKLEQEHSCLYSKLTQDHSQFDFDCISSEIQIVRVVINVIKCMFLPSILLLFLSKRVTYHDVLTP